MARVISNRRLSPDFYLLEAELPAPGGALGDMSGVPPVIRSGQFYMLRSWDKSPLLSRPLSVFDAGNDSVSFLYKTVGQGTALFSRLRVGDELTLQGPLGRGFPELTGRIAMVGGGAGIAPFYLGAKQRKAAGCGVDLFLGFSGESFLTGEYGGVGDSVTVNVGGFITNDIDPAGYDWVFTCGPEIMMKVLWEKCRQAGVEDRLYVSLESRMACGVGVCYGCSRKTAEGNRKVCKHGPVFPANEVFAAQSGDEL
jgi:dihydroorotate dehydrogenase electron transfer subunit